MKVTFPCPDECDQEEHETEVQGELGFGSRVGWYGGVELGDKLPCGYVLTMADTARINDRILEALTYDPTLEDRD